MKKKRPARRKKPAAAKALPLKTLHPDFARVVKAFTGERDVTPPHEGRVFGFRGLKTGGKLFAMMSSKRHFVVKLPKDRVAALVMERKGTYFDPGHGRLMKEWLEMQGHERLWLDLAREARDFVRDGAKRSK
ncbi:MAG TPA: hypothetical protein VGV16_03370 [Gammaproteobacteria bacterium]|nr:hypothetical protein [Gammaproteobacteria bacterium]